MIIVNQYSPIAHKIFMLHFKCTFIVHYDIKNYFLFLKLLVPEIICKIVIKFKIETEGRNIFVV
jgi:hypothetical protein